MTTNVLGLVADKLTTLVPDVIPEIKVETDRIIALNGALEITARHLERKDGLLGPAHVHIVSRVAGYPLDACVMGMDPDKEKAIAQAVKVWFEVAFPPIISTIYGEEIMGARHSHDGLDPWAVPGRHSFMGPLANRSKLSRPELEKVAEAPLFRDAEKLAPATGLHLAKVTLYTNDGKWVREVEIDGEENRHCELGFRFGVEPPEGFCGITSFAVFGEVERG